MEIWNPIPQYEGYYEVSNLGNVKSIEKIVEFNHWITNKRHKKINKEKILKQNNVRGYKCVCLYKNNIGKFFRVNRLVALAFLGPSDLQVDHIDNDKNNNNLNNLQYLSAKENLIKSKKFRHIIGETGTSYFKRDNKWRASKTIDGKFYHIGLFDNRQDAYNAVINFTKNEKV
jgi:vacuolar-type H+-ATPase subunit I/STV1